MSLVEQTIKALKDKAVLLIMITTAKGKEQNVGRILKEVAIENGAEVIIAVKVNRITPE